MRAPFAAVAAALVLALIAMFAVSAVTAADDDNALFQDLQVLSSTAGQVTASATRNRNGEVDEALVYRVSTNGVPRKRVTRVFVQEGTNDTANAAAGFSVALGAYAIVEYTDSGDAGVPQALDLSDTVLQVYALYGTGATWSDLAVSTSTATSVNGSAVTLLEMASQTPATGEPVFSFVAAVAEGTTALADGGYAGPRRIKVSWTIENFPYQDATNASYLAIVGFVDVAGTVARRGSGADSSATGLATSTGRFSGVANAGGIAWNATVQVLPQNELVDVITRAVLTRSTTALASNIGGNNDIDLAAGERRWFVAWSIATPHPETVIWDPDVEVTSAGSSVVVMAMAVVIAALFALMF